jgi:hypothetical protein
MEITAGPLDWASNDEQNWAAFLNTETGRRFVSRLLEAVPSLLDEGDTNKILIRTGVVRGFQLAVQELMRMAQAQGKPEQVVDNYPPLEKDEAWADGKKLDPTLKEKPDVLEPDFTK